MKLKEKINLGVHGPLVEWLEFNRTEAFQSPANLALVASFPPTDRMHITTGLTKNCDFAAHGAEIFRALNEASPKQLSLFGNILDFGVGVGRLARMFYGFHGNYTGVDVDAHNIAWLSNALRHVNAIHTLPRATLPFAFRQFDLVISVSVFSHMNQQDHLFYLSEIARIAKPGAVVMITIHGKRALERAESEARIFQMLSVPQQSISETREILNNHGFSFIRQDGHLTNSCYDYGITFISKAYIESCWSKMFEILDYRSGAIHDFQDIVVMRLPQTHLATETTKWTI